jgi:hypothetical protein
MAALEKIYQCLACKQDIRLERKDNQWVKWNLDGTAHVHPPITTRKKEDKQVQQQHEQRDAEIKDWLAEVKATIKLVLTQIQLLRQEVEQLKK